VEVAEQADRAALLVSSTAAFKAAVEEVLEDTEVTAATVVALLPVQQQPELTVLVAEAVLAAQIRRAQLSRLMAVTGAV
jgi:hypothetical protein